MTLRTPNSNAATGTFNRSKNIVPMSGLCSTCLDGCKGGCEIWLSSFRGREVLYPGPYGDVTSGADKEYPVDFSHLNIQGYISGAKGLPKGIIPSPDTAIFTKVNTETEYGWNDKVKMRVPIFTGALGSTEIARKNWEHLAIGAAISGITLVCGENVCGMDPGLEFDKHGKIKKSPEMDRRIKVYKRYHEGYGEMLVQINIEDAKLGVAEYILKKHNISSIEIKWGQGAKSIGGEVKIKDIKRAVELKKRGYIVIPDPTDESVIKSYKNGALKEFERHSRVGFISKESFLKQVEELRKIGIKRITLKTGAFSADSLAKALRYGTEAKLDLITIDGAPGGTGMSPWPMMNEWGIPTFYIASLVYNYCMKLKSKGLKIPDIALGGGFSSEDNVFKGMAMTSPFVKAICMGRGIITPAFVGKNIGLWLKNGDLPKTVSKYGDTKEKIFIYYEELKSKYGKEIDNLPLGAIGIYSFTQKFKSGLQQIMAGSRNFNLSSISRKDLMSLTEEASNVSGIKYIMDAYSDEADKILDGN